MTSHRTTLGPHRFGLIEQRRLRWTTLPYNLAALVKAGHTLTIAETVPDGSQPTGWVMECIITDVTSSLTMPGLFDREVVAVSLEVMEVYPAEVEIIAEQSQQTATP